nr:PREDICTED: uncharacterized protein LOC109042414 [Bemisia tabaci]
MDWLNKNKLRRVLQKQIPHLSDDDILSYKVEEESSKGNNYSSRIFRIVVHMKEEGTSQPKYLALFSKAVINNAFGRTLKETGILAKEHLIYDSIIPKINAFLDNDFVSPIPYHSPQLGTIILEDLCDKGYKLINRIERLDYPKAVLVLRKLAKLHAASVALHKVEPELVEEAGKEIGLDETFKEQFVTFLDNALALVADRLVRWSEIEDHQKYAQGIRNVQKTFYTKMLRAREIPSKMLHVLNHGDLWLTNILFKFDEKNNSVKDCKFVDFQLSFYASPVIDLHYLLAANVQFHVFENSQEALLQEYLQALNTFLIEFNTNVTLSYEDLKAEYDRTQIVSFYAGIVILIPVLADPEQATDFSNYSDAEMEETSVFDGIVDSKYYRKELPKYLKYYKDKGILN